MTANLRATAEVADAIAGGDLSVEPKPLSDKDALGLALQRMTDKLRVVVEPLAAAGNVSTGSERLLTAAHELAAGADDQAASAEVSSSMEQIAANIKQNAANAGQDREDRTPVLRRRASQRRGGEPGRRSDADYRR